MTQPLKTILVSLILLLSLPSVTACKQEESVPSDQVGSAGKSALLPELFDAQLAADDDNRHSALAFAPDGSELFYSVYVNNQGPQKIFVSKNLDGAWSDPTLAPFSGTYKDGGPLISDDGKRLYFYSNRPVPPATEPSGDYDLWYVERTADGWGKPVNPGAPVNTGENESTYALANDGDIYFTRYGEDKRNLLLKSRHTGEAFIPPGVIKELTDQVSFFEPVAIDGEDFFIFTNNVQKGRFYYTALFISYRNEDGSWTRPKDMGDMINFGEGRFPSLSPDGRYLYFLSYRTGISRYYRVDAGIIDYLRTHDLDLVKQLKTIMQDTGFTAMKSALESFNQEHADYYRFDKTLLNEVASELVSEDAIAKAIEVYELNFKRYPQQDFYPQKLIVALLRESETDFSSTAGVIESQAVETHEELLDGINIAGEVFLRKGRTDDAIRIFELNARTNPTSTWPHYKLGKAYYQLEDHETARKYFSKALHFDANNIYAKNYLEEIGFPQLTGPYLGQEPPGMTAEIFASGILVARDGDAINSVFSPDGQEFYYVVLEDQSPRYNLWFTEITDGTWAKPKELRLAGDYEVADIALSPDGNRLYFCSDMPTFWEDAEGFDIWYAERTGGGWSEPINAGKNINSPGGETQPSFTADGTMFFPSWHEGSQTESVDLYYSRFIDGAFMEPVRLPDSVNSEYNEGNSFVAPDGSFILFARWNMPESIDGGKGLYISFKKPDGSWTQATNTAAVLPIRGSLAALTHDGRHLLWSTPQGIHWVDVRALEQLKPDELR